MTVAAILYDGRSSERRHVQIDPIGSGAIRVTGEGIEREWRLSEVRVSSRVGNTARNLYFPDGSQCETSDNDGVDRLLAGSGRGRGSALHRLERSIGYALLALAFTALAAWLAIAHGIPALANQVALRMPPSAEEFIGRDALRALDQALLAPSALASERQAQLRLLFSELLGRVEGASNYRLELRASRHLGANALALPSGIVVVTDGLVELAQNDQELIAVLAHEIGHIKHRHALRSLLQNSATALLIAVAIGDITSITSLAAALPTVLLHAKYSRQFENEADDFALDYLANRKIPAARFSAILDRMERKGSMPSGLDYLATHPATRERIDRARTRQ